MSLISPGGENLLDFLKLWQVLSTFDGDLRDPLCWPQESQSPCELLGGLSGFLSRRCRCLRPCVEWCWNLSIPLQCRHVSWGTSGVSPGESVLVSSRGMHVRFPPSCSSSVELPFARIKGSVAFPRGFPTTLSHDTFPPGFPTRLSHSGVPHATVVSVDPQFESRGSAGETGFPGMD